MSYIHIHAVIGVKSAPFEEELYCELIGRRL